ncbi:MAG: BON domain-containing protein [Pseudomonadota bacterium]
MSNPPNLLEDCIPEAREPAGYLRSDAAIRRELEGRLAGDRQLDAAAIHMEVCQGEITLSGEVRHGAEMRSVEAHACAIAGVTVVHNHLEPRAGPPSDDGAPGPAARMGKPSFER